MINREIYVIFSPGRTGSHIILEAISGIANTPGGLCNATCYWDANNPTLYESYDMSSNIVIHTHNLSSTVNKLNLNPKDVTLILSYRRDLFAQTMSVIVAELSNEWNGKDYSDKPITPVIISRDEFRRKMVGPLNHQIPRINEYKKVVTIFYEDLVAGGAEYIASMLDINYNEEHVGKIHRKSPYSYKDCVLNWEELLKEFCKIGVPREIISPGSTASNK